MTKLKKNFICGVRPPAKRVGLAVSRPIYAIQQQIEAILAGQSVGIH